MNKAISAALLTLTFTTAAAADDLTGRAVIGGGLGGALGAFVGSELGGRSGAIVGGAIGGATGTAIATQGYERRRVVRVREVRPVVVERYYDYDDDDYYERGYRHHHHRDTGYFCPPGQAKKGRC